MKNSLSLLLVPLLATSLNAETFYIKGKKAVVGKKISDDGKVSEIQYFEGEGIKVFMKVKNSDILRVTREDLEEKDFNHIKTLAVTPDLQEAKWYQSQIDKYIKKFYKEFPSSRKRPEVKVIERMLKDEMNAIKAGGLKLNGKIISAEERAASAYDIDSQILGLKFAEAVKKGDYGKAIALADQMALDFPKSAAYGIVVEKLKPMAMTYRGRLELMREQYHLNKKQDDKAMKNLSAEKVKMIMQARKSEDALVLAKIAKEKEDGVKWLTVNPRSLESIDQQMKNIDQYLAEVETLVSSYQQVDAGTIYTKSWKMIEAKKFDEAKELIDQLDNLGVNIGYLGKLEEFYEEEKDLFREAERNKIRGRKPDLFDQYADIDEYIQETIVEATDYIDSVKDLESAKECRGRMKVFVSRLDRLYKRREGLAKMSAGDMETQNAELAQLIDPLLEEYSKKHVKLLAETEFIAVLKEPMMALKAKMPNPNDYLSENVKRLMAEKKAAAEAAAKLGPDGKPLEPKKPDLKGGAPVKPDLNKSAPVKPNLSSLNPVGKNLLGKTVYLQNGQYAKSDITGAPTHYLFYVSASW